MVALLNNRGLKGGDNMAWIRVIDENNAMGELKETYEFVRKKRGKISNVMRLHSLNPKAMQAHIELYLTLMFGQSGLTREDRELIGVVVSSANECEYCVQHHAMVLNHYWKDNERVRALTEKYDAAGLPHRQYHMALYARKLTMTPGEISRENIDALRKCGFSDDDILDINLITAYFCFVNRIVLGLGVEFTPVEMRGYRY
jgi:uncharacterized peroxidase-related enzyme